MLHEINMTQQVMESTLVGLKHKLCEQRNGRERRKGRLWPS